MSGAMASSGPATEDRGAGLVCERCSGEPAGLATQYCKQCDMLMCEPCKDQHGKHRGTAKHLVQSVCDCDFAALRQHLAGAGSAHVRGACAEWTPALSALGSRSQELQRSAPKNGVQFEPAEAFQILIECKVRRIKLKPLVQDWVRSKRIPVGYSNVMRHLQHVHRQVCSGGKVEDMVPPSWDGNWPKEPKT
jgi:hypothetical protein